MRSFTKRSIPALAALLVAACDGQTVSPVDTVNAVPSGQAQPPMLEPKTPPAPEPQPEPEPQFPAKMLRASQLLTKAADGDTTGWDRMAFVADTFGPRLSGSKGLELAIDWAVETFKNDGYANARREKAMVTHWVRGEESARVVAPRERPLFMLGLGNSVGTPRRGIKAEVIAAQDVESIAALGDKAKGKIVVVTQAMKPYDQEKHESGYGDAVQPRLFAAREASKVGAKAVLVRSVTAYNWRTPHTGTLVYDETVKKIPAAALAPEDMMYVERELARGRTVEIELKMGAKMYPKAESANVVAELEGREKPDEVVVIGCHWDAWDVGDGAHDDGAPCMHVMEAMRALKKLDLVPRRTIRAVLFANEENGGGGRDAYYEAHKAEKHVAAMESDSGSFAPQGFGIGRDEAELAQLTPYAPLFEGLGASDFRQGGGGADIAPLTKAGVLSVAVRPDGSHYFDLHHTHADTVDKVEPDHLQRNAMAMALMAFILAERE